MPDFEEKVENLTHLTEEQRAYLNKHFMGAGWLSKGKGLKAAENYNRRRGKVLAELQKIPNLGESVKLIRSQLQQADDLATQGDFRQAYRALEEVKNQAKQLASAYNPQPDVEQLEREIEALTKRANEAIEEYQELDEWIKEIPSFMEGILANPGEEQLNEEAKEQRQEFLAELRSDFESDWNIFAALPITKQFLKEANKQLESIRQRVDLIVQASAVSGKKSNVENAVVTMSRGLFESKPLAPLCRNGEYFFSPSEFVSELYNRKKQCLKHIVPDVDDLRLAINVEQVREEQELDHLNSELKEGKQLRPVPEKFQTFEMGDMLSSFKKSLPNTETRISSKDPKFIDLVEKAKSHFSVAIKKMNPQGDPLFDLSMKSKEEITADLLRDFSEKQGWPAKRSQLNNGQKATLDAIAKGLFNSVREEFPDKIALGVNAEEPPRNVTIGGVEYGEPQFLGKGGLGKIYRYTDKSGNPVVVKELIDPGKREHMKREIIANRYLMAGDENAPGRKNLVMMKGAVQDEKGGLYMVMEEAGGGDMKKMRGAITGLSESGALPEMAKNVLNQFLFKQSIEGLTYLRDQNLIHFDLKDENIMLGTDGTVKLGDFGGTYQSQEQDGSILMSDLGSKFQSTISHKDSDFDERWTKFAVPFAKLRNSLPICQKIVEGGFLGNFGDNEVAAINSVAEVCGLERIRGKNTYEQYVEKAKAILPLGIKKLEELKREGIQEKGSTDTSYDTFSMGKVAQVMHTGTQAPTFIGQGQQAGEKSRKIEGMTGALDRITSAMTSKDPNDRPDLEQILESSYVKNLEQYDPKDIELLLQKVMAYSKRVDTEQITKLQTKIGPVGSGTVGNLFNEDGILEWTDAGTLRDQLATVEMHLRDSQTNPNDKQMLTEKHKSLLQKIESIQQEVKELSEPTEAERVLKLEIAELSKKFKL